MDVIFTSNPLEENPDDDTMVGDNAMSIDRGASFLMGEDPKKDPVKVMTKASIGDAPMGEKPTENPLESNHLSLPSRVNPMGRNVKPDTSFGGETTIAKASALGPNPLGLNPFGLDESELERLGISLQTERASVRGTETVSEKKNASASENGAVPSSVKESKKEPEKAEKQIEVPLGNVYSLSDPNFPGGRIIFCNFSFGSRDELTDATAEEEKYIQVFYDEGILENASETKGIDEGKDVLVPDDDDFKPLGGNDDDDFMPLGGNDDDDFKPLGRDDDDDGSGLIYMERDSEEDDPMGLTYGVSDADNEPLGLMAGESDFDDDQPQESSSEKKQQDNASGGIDPLRELLLAGGNPFGENSKIIAPDLSFGKEALKPKHFEPMKASGPKVNVENMQENNPLGNNPFGKDVAPDASFGKDALKPKKYVPKKTYEE